MITVTLGTIPYPFDRAVDWINACLEKGVIQEPVVLQHGVTNVDRVVGHDLITAVPLLTSDAFAEVFQRSRLIVAHAGQGSTRKLARSNKSFTIMPRQAKYGEHIDNHQLDFVQNVMSFGYGVHVCMSLNDLESALIRPPRPIQKDLFEGPKLSDYLIEKYPGSVVREPLCLNK